MHAVGGGAFFRLGQSRLFRGTAGHGFDGCCHLGGCETGGNRDGSANLNSADKWNFCLCLT